MNRLILLVESRIRGDVYVRFGGELPKTHRSNTAGRWMLSLPRRWMIAQQEFPGPEYSLNLLATSYEDSWSRTSNVWKGGPRVFEPKHYFFPINQEQLSEMKNITQNYGW